MIAFGRAVADGGAILEGAEDENAFLPDVLQRGHKGTRAGGEDQHIVGFDDLVARATDVAADRVDAVRLDAIVQMDASLLVPLARVEPKLAWLGFASEHARKQDAVVGSIGFSSEH